MKKPAKEPGNDGPMVTVSELMANAEGHVYVYTYLLTHGEGQGSYPSAFKTKRMFPLVRVHALSTGDWK